MAPCWVAICDQPLVENRWDPRLVGKRVGPKPRCSRFGSVPVIRCKSSVDGIKFYERHGKGKMRRRSCSPSPRRNALKCCLSKQGLDQCIDADACGDVTNMKVPGPFEANILRKMRCNCIACMDFACKWRKAVKCAFYEQANDPCRPRRTIHRWSPVLPSVRKWRSQDRTTSARRPSRSPNRSRCAPIRPGRLIPVRPQRRSRLKKKRCFFTGKKRPSPKISWWFGNYDPVNDCWTGKKTLNDEEDGFRTVALHNTGKEPSPKFRHDTSQPGDAGCAPIKQRVRKPLAQGVTNTEPCIQLTCRSHPEHTRSRSTTSDVNSPSSSYMYFDQSCTGSSQTSSQTGHRSQRLDGAYSEKLDSVASDTRSIEEKYLNFERPYSRSSYTAPSCKSHTSTSYPRSNTVETATTPYRSRTHHCTNHSEVATSPNRSIPHYSTNHSEVATSSNRNIPLYNTTYSDVTTSPHQNKLLYESTSSDKSKSLGASTYKSRYKNTKLDRSHASSTNKKTNFEDQRDHAREAKQDETTSEQIYVEKNYNIDEDSDALIFERLGSIEPEAVSWAKTPKESKVEKRRKGKHSSSLKGHKKGGKFKKERSGKRTTNSETSNRADPSSSQPEFCLDRPHTFESSDNAMNDDVTDYNNVDRSESKICSQPRRSENISSSSRSPSTESEQLSHKERRAQSKEKRNAWRDKSKNYRNRSVSKKRANKVRQRSTSQDTIWHHVHPSSVSGDRPKILKKKEADELLPSLKSLKRLEKKNFWERDISYERPTMKAPIEKVDQSETTPKRDHKISTDLKTRIRSILKGTRPYLKDSYDDEDDDDLDDDNDNYDDDGNNHAKQEEEKFKRYKSLKENLNRSYQEQNYNKKQITEESCSGSTEVPWTSRSESDYEQRKGRHDTQGSRGGVALGRCHSRHGRTKRRVYNESEEIERHGYDNSGDTKRRGHNEPDRHEKHNSKGMVNDIEVQGCNRYNDPRNSDPFYPSRCALVEPPATSEDEWLDKHVRLMVDCGRERHRTACQRMHRILDRSRELAGSIHDVTTDLNDMEGRMKKVSKMQKEYLQRSQLALDLAKQSNGCYNEHLRHHKTGKSRTIRIEHRPDCAHFHERDTHEDGKTSEDDDRYYIEPDGQFQQANEKGLRKTDYVTSESAETVSRGSFSAIGNQCMHIHKRKHTREGKPAMKRPETKELTGSSVENSDILDFIRQSDRDEVSVKQFQRVGKNLSQNLSGNNNNILLEDTTSSEATKSCSAVFSRALGDDGSDTNGRLSWLQSEFEGATLTSRKMSLSGLSPVYRQFHPTHRYPGVSVTLSSENSNNCLHCFDSNQVKIHKVKSSLKNSTSDSSLYKSKNIPLSSHVYVSKYSPLSSYGSHKSLTIDENIDSSNNVKTYKSKSPSEYDFQESTSANLVYENKYVSIPSFACHDFMTYGENVNRVKKENTNTVKIHKAKSPSMYAFSDSTSTRPVCGSPIFPISSYYDSLTCGENGKRMKKGKIHKAKSPSMYDFKDSNSAGLGYENDYFPFSSFECNATL